jgi:MinD superfamily P-loop ATPase
VIASVSGVDLALVVTEPTASGFSDLKRLLRTAEVLGVRVAVCVNRFDVHPQTGLLIERYCNEQGVPLAGRVPSDPHVPEAINAGFSIAEVDCPARAALLRVFDNVMGLLKEGTA